MQITIEVPESLPQERVQQRIKELEISLREEAKFLAAVQGLVDTVSDGWLGCMADTGTITGDILVPTSELVSWEALEI